MRSTILMALSIALLVPDAASACHCRSSCSGGNCYGSCSGGGCYGSCSGCHGGWSGCHGANYGCHGSWSGCYGSGNYHAWNSNGYYSNGYAGNYSVYPGTAYYGSPSSRTSSYYDANGIVMTGNGKQARVDVILPDANADLIIQDQKTNTLGTRRSFISPELEPGKKFTYTLKMQRNVGGRTEDEIRTVEVQAGSVITVDFTKPKTDSFLTPHGSSSNQLPVPNAPKPDKVSTPDSSSKSPSPPR